MVQKKGYLLKGRVIDGSLNAPIERGAVVVQGDRIQWVGAAASLPKQYDEREHEVVDLRAEARVPRS